MKKSGNLSTMPLHRGEKSSMDRFGNAFDWFHRLIEFWKRPVFAMCRLQGNAATPLSNKNEI